jgi:hypothetical protein
MTDTPDDASLYALEKLTYAVHALATADNVRARLFEASMDLLRVRADQLPDEQMRRDFEWIRTKLTSVTPTGNEGTVVATLRGISDEDAEIVVCRILDLHRELHDRLMR